MNNFMQTNITTQIKWAHFGKTQVVKNWCQPEGKGQKCWLQIPTSTQLK